MRWPFVFLAKAVLVFLVACTFAKQPLVAPPNDVTTVLLVTGTLGHPLDGIARHPWLAVRRKGAEQWQLYEVPGETTESDPFDRGNTYGNPILHAVWRGDEADRAADCIAREAHAIIRDIDDHYIFYPGPNSNTFGDRILRKCHLHASLPSTSVGKDWRGWIGAGVTSEGTGVQLETPIVGFKIGLKEGIEVHVIGLAIGVDFWPPAIILPLGPGRLGFEDR